jgi:hypothetical protein
VARWYLQHPGEQPIGPIEAKDLRAAWHRQQVPTNTLVCAEELSQWVPFHSVADLVMTPASDAGTRLAPSTVDNRPPASLPAPRRFWAVLSAVCVFAVLQYAGCQVLVGGFAGAANANGNWPGFMNLTAGEQIMLTLMTLVCLGGPLAFVGGSFAIWVFARKKSG